MCEISAIKSPWILRCNLRADLQGENNYMGNMLLSKNCIQDVEWCGSVFVKLYHSMLS